MDTTEHGQKQRFYSLKRYVELKQFLAENIEKLADHPVLHTYDIGIGLKGIHIGNLFGSFGGQICCGQTVGCIGCFAYRRK